MKILEYILLSIVIMLSSCIMYISICDAKKSKYEWVCFVNGSECGTYGISKFKEQAYELAYQKCVNECGLKCKLDYCEKRR